MDPLHGITLEKILIYLVENIGWEAMYAEVKVNCFKFDASTKSSLAATAAKLTETQSQLASYVKLAQDLTSQVNNLKSDVTRLDKKVDCLKSKADADEGSC